MNINDELISDELIDYLWGKFQAADDGPSGLPDHRGFARELLKAISIKNVRLAESYRMGNTTLIERLMGLAWLFVGAASRDAVMEPTAAGVAAFEQLVQVGYAEKIDAFSYRLLWTKLEQRIEAEKPVQLSWAEAVDLLVTDEEQRARLLALDEADAKASMPADSEGGEA